MREIRTQINLAMLEQYTDHELWHYLMLIDHEIRKRGLEDRGMCEQMSEEEFNHFTEMCQAMITGAKH